MPIGLSDLLAADSLSLPGEPATPGNRPDIAVTGITDDSRQVKPGYLFVARSGFKLNGHDFIPQAVANGAAAILTDRAPVPSVNVPVIIADQLSSAAGKLAHRFWADPSLKMRVMAVTGTNGKTTIAYLTRSLFKAMGVNCGLIGTVEIDDGVRRLPSPMTTPGAIELARQLALMQRNGLEAVAMEASSHALDQDRLAGVRVSVGMFSNLTGDHLDYHLTMDRYAAAKARLFTALDGDATAVVNADDDYASIMVRNTPARVMTYGIKRAADLEGRVISMDQSGMQMKVSLRGSTALNLHSPMVGVHNAQNILCALAGAISAGFALEQLVVPMSVAGAAPGRLQRVEPAGLASEKLPFAVFVDYAHTHDALENVLTALRPLTGGRLICVFGCGGDRDKTKRPLMGAVAEKLADRVIVTSDNPRTEKPEAIIDDILRGFSMRSGGSPEVISDRRAAITAAVEMAAPNDTILIAGKGHENYQIIGTERHHFDDVQCASQAIEVRLRAEHHEGGRRMDEIGLRGIT